MAVVKPCGRHVIVAERDDRKKEGVSEPERNGRISAGKNQEQGHHAGKSPDVGAAG
jgi:hypothetical protein